MKPKRQKLSRKKQNIGLSYASKAYRQLRDMELNPRNFLPSMSFMAKQAELEALPEEDWISKVKAYAFDILREQSSPNWSLWHRGAK